MGPKYYSFIWINWFVPYPSPIPFQAKTPLLISICWDPPKRRSSMISIKLNFVFLKKEEEKSLNNKITVDPKIIFLVIYLNIVM